jgi:hypothetical protein
MLYTRRLIDYTRLRIARRARPLASLGLLSISVLVLIATSLLSVPPVWYYVLKGVGLAGTATSASLLLADFRRWYDTRHDLIIVPDEAFGEKVAKFVVQPGNEKYSSGNNLIEFSEQLNLRLDGMATQTTVLQSPYRVPRILQEYIEIAIDLRQPSKNEDKVRLASNIDLNALASPHGVDLQKTNYFNGMVTNEMGQSLFYYADRSQNRREFVCSVFDNHVSRRGGLIALSESALSNHIGVTSLVITADAYMVLQRQGTTQIDSGKMNLGASGSADWSDIVGSAPAKGVSPTLQDLVRFAMEREAGEELNAARLFGKGKSKTTITGFGRYVHRGGKPEFFGITFLNVHYDQIPPRVRSSERKWVITKEKRAFGNLTVSGLVAGIDNVISEFKEHQAGEASMSMQVGLMFARNYAVKKLKSFDELKPV